MIIPFCYVPLEADTKNYIRSIQTDVTVDGESNFQDSSFVLDGTNTIRFNVTERRQVFTKNAWAICFQVNLTEGTAGTLFKCAGYELTYAADGTVTLVTPAGSSTSAQAAIFFGEATHVALRYSNAAWSVWCNQASILEATNAPFTLTNPFEPVIIGPATGTIGKVCLYDRAVPYFNEYELVEKSFGFYTYTPEYPYANESVSEFTTDSNGFVTFVGVKDAPETLEANGIQFTFSDIMGSVVLPRENVIRKVSLENVEGLSWDVAKGMWYVETPGAVVDIPVYQNLNFRFWIEEDKGGQITDNFYLGDNYAVLGNRRIIWEHDRDDSSIADRLILGRNIVKINDDCTYHDIGNIHQITLDFKGWISDIDLYLPITKEMRFTPGEVSRVDVYRRSNGGIIGHYFPDADGRCIVDIFDRFDQYMVIHYINGATKARVEPL